MHAISSYRGNRPTNTHKHMPATRPLQTHPQTGPITIHCAAKLSTQCNKSKLLEYMENKEQLLTTIIDTNVFVHFNNTTSQMQ